MKSASRIKRPFVVTSSARVAANDDDGDDDDCDGAVQLIARRLPRRRIRIFQLERTLYHTRPRQALCHAHSKLTSPLFESLCLL
jgi:hypothetical protein